jgi:hypothetical protein
MPLLVVSSAWTDAAADAFASAPIEATDIAPTVVELLGGTNAVDGQPFEPARSSLLKWRDGQWTFAPDARLQIDAVPRAPKWPTARPFIAPRLGPLTGECDTQVTIEHPEGISIARVYWDSRYRISERRNRQASVSLLHGYMESDVVQLDPPKPARLSATRFSYRIPRITVDRTLTRLRKLGPLGHKRPRGPLLKRFGDTPAKKAPSLAFLSLIACDQYDRCHSRPLISDRDFDDLMKRCRK